MAYTVSGTEREETVAIEMENSCRNCGLIINEFELKLSRLLRKIYVFCCATFVFCVIALIACGFCIYLYTESVRMKTQARSVSSEPLHGDGSSDVYYYEYLNADDEYNDVYNVNETSEEVKTDQHREKRKDVQDDSKEDKNTENIQRTPNKDKRRRGRELTKKLEKLKKTVDIVKREVQNIQIITKPPLRTSTLNPTTTTTTTKDTPRQQNFIPHVAAAHYTSFVDNEYIRDQFPPLDPGNLRLTPYNSNGKPDNQTGYIYKEHCKISKRFSGTLCKNMMLHLDGACIDKPDWSGQLCRNRTLITSAAPTRLNVFREAPWMKNISSQQVFDMRDGVFHAKHTGIYLVYAHVLFYDSSKTQAIELVHGSGGKDPNKFRCVESVDNDVPKPGFVRDTGYMSCSINIVVYMQKNDTIEVQNLFPNSSIDLSTDSTYFGGLVFVNVND